MLSDARYWIFDLDHTLYPATNLLFDQTNVTMGRYLRENLGLPDHEASALRQRLWDNYGTTQKGLEVEFGVPPEDFLEKVHDIDFSVLSPSPLLRTRIEALPGRRIVFTNGPLTYATAALDALGLNTCFDAVYGTESAGLVPKPEARAYEAVFDQEPVGPEGAVFFEDTLVNLEVPKALGCHTVLVHTDADASFVDHQTSDLAAFLGQIAAPTGQADVRAPL